MTAKMLAYLNHALESSDHRRVLAAIGEAVRAQYSITEFAKITGLGRSQLHQILFSGKANPTLKNMIKIFHGLGLQLTVTLADKKEGK
jgi:probable addiction module antidote protein